MRWFWVPMVLILALIALGMLIDEQVTRAILEVLIAGERPEVLR